MLYKTSNPYPNNDVVDVTKNFNFECMVDAGIIYGYTLYTGEIGKTPSVYVDNPILTQPIYSNNGANSMLSVRYNADSGILSNGMNYVWKLRLYDNSPTVWTAYGNIVGYTDSKNVNTSGNNGDGIKYQDQKIYESDLSIKTSDGYGKFCLLTIRPHSNILYNCDSDFISSNSSQHTQYSYRDKNKNVIDNIKYYITVYGKQHQVLRYCVGTSGLNAYVVVPYNDDFKVFAGNYEIYSNFLDTDEYVLKARVSISPTITILNASGSGDGSENSPKEIGGSSATFLGSFEDNSINITNYQYIIEQKISGEWTVINDTGRIYSSYMQYKYDIFLFGTEYRIHLIVTDIEDRILDAYYYIKPTYASNTVDFVPTISHDCVRGCFVVNFEDMISIPFKPFLGNKEGYYVDDENNLVVNNGAGGTFNEVTGRGDLFIPTGFSTVVQFKIQNAYTGVLYAIYTDLPSGSGDMGSYVYISWDESYLVVNSNAGLIKETFKWTPYTTQDGQILTSSCLPSDRSGDDPNSVYKYVWNDDAVWDDTSIWQDSVPLEEDFYTLMINDGVVTISKVGSGVNLN